MPNITLSVKDDVIRKVCKIAIDQDTTLTAMVRDYLRSVALQGDGERRKPADTTGAKLRTVQSCNGDPELDPR
jgi:hypothetical protein